MQIREQVTFSHLDVFQAHFYFCLLVCVFVLLFGYVFALLVLFGAFCACKI